MYNSTGFVNVNFTHDDIVFSSRKDFDFDGLIYSKLVGNKMSAFRITDRKNDSGAEIWNYCEIDLNELVEKKVDVPFALYGNRPMPKYFVNFLVYFHL